MAAPMARVVLRTYCCRVNTSRLNTYDFKQLQLSFFGKTSHRVQSRTLHRLSCVYSPRGFRHIPSKVLRSESDQADRDAGDKRVFSPGPADGIAVEGDVHIRGDSTEATVPYRRRMEREIWNRPVTEDGSGRSLQTPNSAQEMALKIRKELIEKKKAGEKINSSSSAESKTKEADKSAAGTKTKGVDSKGFRTLKHQVQDLSKLQESTVASILYRSVIYNEGDLVAIDKPYGLPSHRGPGVVHSVDSLLPLLAQRLRLDSGARLHMLHRLDKETTGVMLLARNEAAARRLQGLFRARRVGKTYLVLTVGVPSPTRATVDMPMAEREVAGGGGHRMGIRPEGAAVDGGPLGAAGSGRRATQAVTNFQVVSDNGHAALVEVKPETGVKHQIRVHMALGMACPILGDHKYSHHNKLAPQRLPAAILESLGIRQAKARTVPMHLHAKELVLPDYLHGRTLRISTRLPKFFQQNMRRLKLKYS